jgi:hypothetical protein
MTKNKSGIPNKKEEKAQYKTWQIYNSLMKGDEMQSPWRWIQPHEWIMISIW